MHPHGGGMRNVFRKSRPLQPFEDCGDALPAADAHRDQFVTALYTLQLVQRLHCDQRTRRSNRMAQSNASAVGVHLVRIEPERGGHRTGFFTPSAC